MSVFESIAASAPRQAMLWAALGMLGLGLASAGYVLLTNEGSPAARPPAEPRDALPAAPTPTLTAMPGTSATPTALPTATEPPAATATSPAPAAQSNPSPNQPLPTATPPPPAPAATEPPPPAAANRPYCDRTSSSAPPTSVFGTFTIGGAPAPAGTLVFLTFDGVAGPARATSAAGGYRVDFNAGGEECANRAGSTIAVVAGGRATPAGPVGSGEPAIRVDIALP